MHKETKKISATLESFIKGSISKIKLKESAWEIIENSEHVIFASDKKEEEKVFWFTIWQIQHLAEDDITEKQFRDEMLQCLKYLKKEEDLPTHFSGKPPL